MGGVGGREDSDGEGWVVFSCVRRERFMQGGSCFVLVCAEYKRKCVIFETRV